MIAGERPAGLLPSSSLRAGGEAISANGSQGAVSVGPAVATRHRRLPPATCRLAPQCCWAGGGRAGGRMCRAAQLSTISFKCSSIALRMLHVHTTPAEACLQLSTALAASHAAMQSSVKAAAASVTFPAMLVRPLRQVAFPSCLPPCSQSGTGHGAGPPRCSPEEAQQQAGAEGSTALVRLCWVLAAHSWAGGAGERGP